MAMSERHLESDVGQQQQKQNLHICALGDDPAVKFWESRKQGSSHAES